MGKESKKGTKKRLLAAAVLAAILASACILGAPVAHAAGEATECATKYPIVLVHGAGFGDMNAGLSYWGRIPEYLEERGAVLYYGNTDGWSSIEQGAAALKATVDKVLAETGSAKVNLIAHSKGGLEARYMISSLGMAGKVASLTTIATPHGGSRTLDYILDWPDFLLRGAAGFVDVFRWVAGDKKPDFYAGIHSLGKKYVLEFNEKNPDMPGVYYQSFAGEVYAPASDIVMSWPGYIVKDTEGVPNDGMVTVESAQWTNFRGVLRGAGYRGVSHMDEVDFRREDVELEPILGATEIRGFYAALVSELAQMGY